MKRRLQILFVFCLMAVFLMTSLAFAKKPSPPGVSAEGVIYGCFKKVNGQLRIVNGPNQCRPSESSIFWNQVGLQGPEGPPGSPGTTNLFITHQGSGVTLTDAGAEVLSLTVPAGTYAISAKVSVANADSAVQPASCELSTGDTSGVALGAGGAGADDNEQVISLLDAATFGSATPITLTCFTLNGSALEGVLEAIEVGELFQQP